MTIDHDDLLPATYTLEAFIDTLIWLDEESESGQGDYTKRDLAELVADALDSLQDQRCFTCGADTFEMGEYYSVQPELWRTYGVEGMLCIGCLEVRVGRRLVPADFVDAEVNKIEHFPDKSDRLKDRLGILCGRPCG